MVNPARPTLADKGVVTLECHDCAKSFMVDGDRSHTDCPDCFGSNTEMYA